jgi:hypothetical protein
LRRKLRMSAHTTARADRTSAPERVTVDHVRALTTLSDRSALVRNWAVGGKLVVVTPDEAAEGVFQGRYSLLCTRSILLDAGLTESFRAGRLIGPVVEVYTREAAAINEAEASAV